MLDSARRIHLNFGLRLVRRL